MASSSAGTVAEMTFRSANHRAANRPSAARPHLVCRFARRQVYSEQTFRHVTFPRASRALFFHRLAESPKSENASSSIARVCGFSICFGPPVRSLKLLRCAALDDQWCLRASAFSACQAHFGLRSSCEHPFEPKDHLGKYSRDRFGPRHPQLARFGLRVSLPVIERLFRQRHIHRFDGRFATERSRELIAKIGRGEKAYIAGIGIGEFHNTGVALIEVSPKTGMRIICNNEEERFTGRKHTNRHPTGFPRRITRSHGLRKNFLG